MLPSPTGQNVEREIRNSEHPFGPFEQMAYQVAQSCLQPQIGHRKIVHCWAGSLVEEISVALQSDEEVESSFPQRHRDLNPHAQKSLNLVDIFCLKVIWSINNGYIIKWTSRTFVPSRPSLSLRRQKVVVRDWFDCRLSIGR